VRRKRGFGILKGFTACCNAFCICFGCGALFVLRSIHVITRRSIRLISIKVQLRINHMDVCCGPPTHSISAPR
jgi:hypothetical protein